MNPNSGEETTNANLGKFMVNAAAMPRCDPASVTQRRELRTQAIGER
jgi:hypothetical protein